MLPQLLALIVALPGQTGTTMPELWIELDDRGGGVIELVGYARSDVALTGEFSLNVLRRTGGNVARSRQGGRVELQPGRAERLSMMAMGPVGSTDDWNARLELTVAGEVVAVVEMPEQD